MKIAIVRLFGLAVLALRLGWCILLATEEVEKENGEVYSVGLTQEEGKLLDGLRLIIHRNGETEECGENKSGTSILNSINTILDMVDMEAKDLDKYLFESILSAALVHLLPEDSCSGENKEIIQGGLLSFCDSGDEKTPKLPDHRKLIPVSSSSRQSSLPCHFHTREGLRLTSLAMLSNATKNAQQKLKTQCEESEEQKTCKMEETTVELHLYAVAAGRVFMFAPSHVGEIFDVSHVNSEQLPMSLKVLSLQPRIFDIQNFFTIKEADDIVAQLVSEERKSHKIQPSTTGNAESAAKNNQRTSESGFVTEGTATPVKRRSFSLLGFDEYYESFADGLQVLRYNQTKAYTPHHDYFSGVFRNDDHDYDSTHVGTNRFATILLYMNDLEDGGETVFPDAVPPINSLSPEQALEEVRGKYSDVIKPNSWEERLIVTCKTKLSIRPTLARAILFYSQNPDGSLDDLSKHAGCPVLGGTKWLSNIWIWNGPRNTYADEPKIKKANSSNKQKAPRPPPKPDPRSKNVRFKNEGGDPKFAHADLYFQDQFWSNFGSDAMVSVNTFEGHEWNVRVNGAVVKKWVMDARPEQDYEI